MSADFQLPLHLPQYQVPEAHGRWLVLANAGEYSGKREYFYPFKTRFLHKHGLLDGYDLQVIEKSCYSCDGTGIFNHHGYGCASRCWNCSNGVYDRRRIMLRRWLLCCYLFHEPLLTHFPPTTGHKELIKGLIKHEGVSEAQAVRALKRLLLRYEPLTLWNLETEGLRRAGRNLTWKVRWRYRRVWQLLDRAFARFRGPQDDPDDVPF